MTVRGRRRKTNKTILGSVFSVFFLILGTDAARAENRFEVDLFGGSALSLETSLKIDQSDYPEVKFDAHYETRSFDQPLYWVLRFAWLRETYQLELQLTHHKLYLTNNPPEVRHFEITHGYNMLTVNCGFVTRHVTPRVGAGVVIAHTESEVRGVVENGEDGGILDSG